MTFVQPSAPSYEDAIKDDGHSQSVAKRNEFDMERFRIVVTTHKISQPYALILRKLRGYEMVLMVDDSHSMENELTPEDPFAKPVTRWQSAKTMSGMMAEIGSITNRNGISVYFLNRPAIHNVKDVSALEETFQTRPKDGDCTPICDVYNRIIHEKRATLAEGKLLIIILTDGLPTNREGTKYEHERLWSVMAGRDSKRIFVNFVACTDIASDIDYLDGMDTKIENIDTTGFYSTELAQIKMKRGPDAVFTMGDWIVKAAAGSTDEALDKMDETTAPLQRQPSSLKPVDACSCVVL